MANNESAFGIPYNSSSESLNQLASNSVNRDDPLINYNPDYRPAQVFHNPHVSGAQTAVPQGSTWGSHLSDGSFPPYIPAQGPNYPYYPTHNQFSSVGAPSTSYRFPHYDDNSSAGLPPNWQPNPMNYAYQRYDFGNSVRQQPYLSQSQSMYAQPPPSIATVQNPLHTSSAIAEVLAISQVLSQTQLQTLSRPGTNFSTSTTTATDAQQAPITSSSAQYAADGDTTPLKIDTRHARLEQGELLDFESRRDLKSGALGVSGLPMDDSRSEADSVEDEPADWYSELFDWICDLLSSHSFKMHIAAITFAAILWGVAAALETYSTDDSKFRISVGPDSYVWELIRFCAATTLLFVACSLLNWVIFTLIALLVTTKLWAVALYAAAFDGPLRNVLFSSLLFTIWSQYLPPYGELRARLLTLLVVLASVDAIKELTLKFFKGRVTRARFKEKLMNIVERMVILQNVSALAVTAERRKRAQRHKERKAKSDGYGKKKLNEEQTSASKSHQVDPASRNHEEMNQALNTLTAEQDEIASPDHGAASQSLDAPTHAYLPRRASESVTRHSRGASLRLSIASSRDDSDSEQSVPTSRGRARSFLAPLSPITRVMRRGYTIALRSVHKRFGDDQSNDSNAIASTALPSSFSLNPPDHSVHENSGVTTKASETILSISSTTQPVSSVMSTTTATISPATTTVASPEEQASHSSEIHAFRAQTSKSLTPFPSYETVDAQDLRDMDVTEDRYHVLASEVKKGRFKLYDAQGNIRSIANAAVARKIAMSIFTSLNTSKTGVLTVKDIMQAGGDGMDEDQAEELISKLGYRVEKQVPRRGFIMFAHRVYSDFKGLGATLKSYSVVTRAVRLVLNIFYVLSMSIFALLLFGVSPSQVFVPLGTILVSMSFALGGVANNFIQSLVYVLAWKPYDVGDRVRIDGSAPLFVSSIEVYHTAFKRLDGCTQMYANHQLVQKEIRNETRCEFSIIEFIFLVGYRSTPQQLDKLTTAAILWVRERRHIWREDFVEFYVYDVGLNGQMSIAFWLGHRFTLAQGAAVWGDMSKFRLFIVETMRRLGMEYVQPVQPVVMGSIDDIAGSMSGGIGGVPGNGQPLVGYPGYPPRDSYGFQNSGWQPPKQRSYVSNNYQMDPQHLQPHIVPSQTLWPDRPYTENAVAADTKVMSGAQEIHDDRKNIPFVHASWPPDMPAGTPDNAHPGSLPQYHNSAEKPTRMDDVESAHLNDAAGISKNALVTNAIPGRRAITPDRQINHGASSTQNQSTPAHLPNLALAPYPDTVPQPKAYVATASSQGALVSTSTATIHQNEPSFNTASFSLSFPLHPPDASNANNNVQEPSHRDRLPRVTSASSFGGVSNQTRLQDRPNHGKIPRSTSATSLGFQDNQSFGDTNRVDSNLSGTSDIVDGLRQRRGVGTTDIKPDHTNMTDDKGKAVNAGLLQQGSMYQDMGLLRYNPLREEAISQFNSERHAKQFVDIRAGGVGHTWNWVLPLHKRAKVLTAPELIERLLKRGNTDVRPEIFKGFGYGLSVQAARARQEELQKNSARRRRRVNEPNNTVATDAAPRSNASVTSSVGPLVNFPITFGGINLQSGQSGSYADELAERHVKQRLPLTAMQQWFIRRPTPSHGPRQKEDEKKLPPGQRLLQSLSQGAGKSSETIGSGHRRSKSYLFQSSSTRNLFRRSSRNKSDVNDNASVSSTSSRPKHSLTVGSRQDSTRHTGVKSIFCKPTRTPPSSSTNTESGEVFPSK